MTDALILTASLIFGVGPWLLLVGYAALNGDAR